MSEPIAIVGAGGRVLYFELEKVLGGLLSLLRRGHIDECVQVFVRCPPQITSGFVVAARSEGLLKEATNILFRARDFSNAASLSVEAGELLQAAMLFERASEFSRAAELFLQTGDEERAATLFAKAGDTERALALFVTLGENDEAAHLCWQAGDALRAARFFLDEEKPELALDVLLSSVVSPTGMDERAVLLGSALFACNAERLAVSPLLQAALSTSLSKAERNSALDKLVFRLGPSLQKEEWAKIEPVWHQLRSDEFPAPPKSALPDKISSNTIFDDDKKPLVATNPTGDVEFLEARDDESEAYIETLLLQKSLPQVPGLDLLFGLPLFSELMLDDVRLLHAICHVRYFKKGDGLLLRSQPNASLHILLSGEVCVKSEQGVELALLRAGEYIGEMSFFDDETASADVFAQEDVTALVLPKAAFERFLLGDEKRALKLTRHFLRIFSKRLRHTSEKLALSRLHDV
ncbi:MAG: Crp/Fnr family transcriptional regulator [Deltaproteobacteria bacterium]|nr:Crp/Fnr family transcriptional regulator [Deltaproteobacteria bacterium]